MTERLSRRQSMLLGSAALALAGQQARARPYVPMNGAGDQGGWHFCDKCFTMFYAGAAAMAGVCPAGGGGHHAQGFEFQLHYDSSFAQPTPGRDSQFGWRFCEKCFGMFYAGMNAVSSGACPVNAPDLGADAHKHFARGFFFGLPHDNPGNPGQPDWRFCWKCFGLFFDDPGNPFKGHCPGGGAHEMASNSFNFQMPHTVAWAGPQPDNTLVNFSYPPPPGLLKDGSFLDGSVHLVVRDSGDFTFTTHAHDSGPDPIHYAVSAVLLSSSGIAFTFQQEGHLEGTTSNLLGHVNRNDDHTNTGNNPILAREFARLHAGATFKASIVGTDKLVAGVQKTMSDLVDDVGSAAKTIGTTVVTAVVTVFVGAVMGKPSSPGGSSSTGGGSSSTGSGASNTPGAPPDGTTTAGSDSGTVTEVGH